MLEAMAEIGKVIVREGDELENLLKPISKEKNGKKQFLGKINFETKSGKITLSLEEIDEEITPQKYLWIGHVRGSGDQYFVTVQNPSYLVGQVVPNLMKVLDPKTRLWQELEIIREKFYRKMPGGEVVLNVEIPELNGTSETIEQLYELSKNQKDFAEKVTGIVKERFKEMLETKTEVGLWTILIDSLPVSQHPDYKDFILYKKMEESLSNSQEGFCSVCGNRTKVSVDVFKSLTFKYYILDKIGFASGINQKGFFRNHVLCATCYKSLLMAENFVASKLQTRLGNFNVYVIPAFLFTLSPPLDELERWAEYATNSVKVANNFARLEKMEDVLNDYLELNDLDNKILLNFLFYLRNQSELRVLRLIKDVTPSRIKTLVREMRNAGWVGEQLLGSGRYWFIDFTGLYYLIPLRKGKADEFKKLLEIYDALISGWEIGYEFLISQVVGLIQIYMYGRFENTNISDPGQYLELNLAQAVLKANLFMRLLRKLNLLAGGFSVADFLDELHVEEEMKNFLREMKYSEPQASLFLLGYLVNQVARKQYEQGHESKPVLGKINYEGMRFTKIIHFSNMVFNLLRQYKVLYFGVEVIFAEMKKLFDHHVARWPLSPEENVFYLLSGYAYGVQRAVAGARSDKEEMKNGGK